MTDLQPSTAGRGLFFAPRALLAWVLVCITVFAFTASPAKAQGEPAYYGFEPDITTNYIRDTENFRMGYIRVAVEVMVPSTQQLSTVEYHAPLLTDAFIRIFSQASEQQIKSLTGRDDLRMQCLEEAQRLLRRETGEPVVIDVIFTKYIYH